MSQQLAKLLLLWRREEEVEEDVIEWGFCSGAQPFTVRITPFRMSKGVMALFVPFIFPWFQCLLTNRNNLLTIRNNYTNTCVKLTIVTALSFSERIAIANLSCK